MTRAFLLEQHDDLMKVTIDLPGRKVNVLSSEVLDELGKVVATIAADPEIAGVILISGKTSGFVAGADISEIENAEQPSNLSELAEKAQRVFNALEAVRLPVVAAIHGPCLGGGLELALACRWRVLADMPGTSLGLPETTLGIIPCFGGTQRLPRLIGIREAARMITSGQPVSAAEAVRLGLADDLVPVENLLKVSERYARSHRRGRNGVLVSRSSRFLESVGPIRDLLFRRVRAKAGRRYRDFYPAPFLALDAMEDGLRHGLEDGLAAEAHLVAEASRTPAARNLMTVFRLRTFYSRISTLPVAGFRQSAVIGTGVMGTGVASALLREGFRVRLIDESTSALGAALRRIHTELCSRRDEGLYDKSECGIILSGISYDTQIRGLQRADFVMETATEDVELKKALFSDLSRIVRPETLLLTNTASLSISEIASITGNPERVAGMHFFNPVDRMKLVEVVRGERTSEDTLITVSALARRMGKIPLVVRDGPGFVVNRLLVPYVNAATRLLEEGVPAERIDNAFLDFGMPIGALALLDLVGIDIAIQIGENLNQRIGERMRPSPILQVFMEAGRLGRKSGLGFYRYDRNRKRRHDPSLTRFLKPHITDTKDLEDLEIVDRVIFPMVNEAARCLEEGIVDVPEAIDTALIFGAGFPGFTGGLLRYADSVGVTNIVKTLETLSPEDPERFTPTQLLLDMAAQGERFYPAG